MNFLSVIIGILLFYSVGFILMRLFSFSGSFIEKLGISFGLGAGVFSCQMFLYALLNFQINVFGVILPWIVAIVVYAFFFARSIVVPIVPKLNLFSKALAVLILLNIVYVFFQSQLRPLNAWDAVANWSYLSKVVFVDGTITGGFYRFANIDIPYLVSFQEAFIYFIAGSVIDKDVLLLFPMYFLSILFLFYAALRKFSSVSYSLFFTFLLASLPNLLRQAGTYDVGYADISLSYYMFASIILLFSLRKSMKAGNLFLLGIFIGFTTIVKGEGQWFGFILTSIVTVYLFKGKKLRKLIWFLPGMAIFISWKYFSISEQIPSHYLYSGMLQPMRIFQTLELFMREFMYIIRWNFLWVSFLFFVVYRLIKRKVDIFLIVIVLQLFFYMGIYLYTPLDVAGHIKGSLDRFLLQLSPLALYAIAKWFSESELYEKN